MAIVCGTDFTQASFEAARAAAAIGARVHGPVHLVHVVDFPLGPDPDERDGSRSRFWRELVEPELEQRRKLLARDAERLTPSGARIETRIVAGMPEQALVACAEEVQAQLIAIGSLGRRSASPWRLGSVADRLALTSPLPVLIAQSAHPFEAWSAAPGQGRPLRVLYGAEFGATAEAAADWVAQLKTTGPCEVLAAHICKPEREVRRLGIAQRADLPDGDVEHALSEAWRERLGDRVGRTRVVLRRSGTGVPVAEQLTDLAKEEWADLIVLGTHQRRGLNRHWHGSVSYGVLPLAGTNVVLVPSPRTAASRARSIAPMQRVLAVTDLSEHGNRAVACAFALAPRDGRVTVLHVLQPVLPLAAPFGDAIPVPYTTPVDLAREQREIESRLSDLAPPEATELGIEFRVEVVQAADVAETICQRAERLSADVVCMSTHAHGAVAAALLGSTAQNVVRRCGRPVLLIGPPQVS
jgi:nucleotide-binding universal stress UspA family protein